MRTPNSSLLLSAETTKDEVAKPYHIILSKKKAPIIEISEPNEEIVFHF